MPNARNITYRSAVLEALAGEMRRDQNVILMGEDVGAAGGVFKQTDGLFAQFGGERVIDTPISEAGAFGIAVGAAMTGQRPVFEVMFGDFITLIMDQLVNQAAKVNYMSAGQFSVPLVLRTAVGIGANLGPQHSQSLHAWTAHIPGLKVVMPSSPADAKGLMTAAIRDDNPVVFFEDRMLYNVLGEVPQSEHVVPIGSAEVKRSGKRRIDHRNLAYGTYRTGGGRASGTRKYLSRGRRSAQSCSVGHRHTRGLGEKDLEGCRG